MTISALILAGYAVVGLFVAAFVARKSGDVDSYHLALLVGLVAALCFAASSITVAIIGAVS